MRKYNLIIKMSYSNGLLSFKSEGVVSGKGEKGERGEPGVGFKLTDDGNYDIDNKKTYKCW